MSTHTTLSVSFTPPSSSHLNFTATPERCNASTEYLASLVVAYQKHEELNDVPALLTIDYLTAILPDSLMDNITTIDNVADLFAGVMVWYIKALSDIRRPDTNETIDKLVNFPMKDCGQDVCPKLQ